MRSPLTPFLLAAALAGASAFAGARTASLDGTAPVDGTGVGINAGAGATIPGTPGRNATRPPAPPSTRVLGSGPRTPGHVVPDNLPGTMDPGSATVEVNGAGTLDGSVPWDAITNGVGVDGSLDGGVQR